MLTDQVFVREAISAVRLSSVVSLTPPYRLTNEEMAAALDLPALPRICQRIGIQTRRSFLPIDVALGRSTQDGRDCELEVAEQVANEAIQAANISPDEITAFYLISSTIQHGRRIHFERASHELVLRLGLNNRVRRFELDTGCDGFVNVLDNVRLHSGPAAGGHILIVVTSLPSLYLNRLRCSRLPNEAQFSNYVFGDGAAAAIIPVGESENCGIGQATWAGSDPTIDLAWSGISVPENGEAAEITYSVDYAEVGKSYVRYLTRAVRNLLEQNPALDLTQIDRFYFHQANEVLPRMAAAELGIPLSKLASNAGHRGNTGAASVPGMLADDIRNGVVSKGSCLLLAAIGAGLDYSAALVEY